MTVKGVVYTYGCMVLRLSAGWMVLADDRILEYLDLYGSSSPQMIDEDGRIPVEKKYINKRLWKLTDAGLTQKVGRGIYDITNEGEDYLTGEFDARDLPEPE